MFLSSRIVWCYLLLMLCLVFVMQTNAAEEIKDECGHTLSKPKTRWDYGFWKKFFRHLNPFKSKSNSKMQFYLYKRDFPECGRELKSNNTELLELSEFDGDHPTRVIIHGWMSQSKNSLNRAVKDAYLQLTQTSNEAHSDNSNESGEIPSDYNVIVADWSVISTNVNYFGVVDLIEDLGFLVADLMRFLNESAGLKYEDVYIVGHSLGAQIAGSAGKQSKPHMINTIYALDPAGPKFRDASDEYRIDASDAMYVESILTSSTLGFHQNVGHATFYPNFGSDQKKCYKYGCSHSRAHHYFAESITSKIGFWGTKCERQASDVWVLTDPDQLFQMGGEPSSPKNGTFYVKTNDRPPYAMGRTNLAVPLQHGKGL